MGELKTAKIKAPTPQAIYQTMLTKIFKFYATQQKIQGIGPTFEDLERDNKLWTVGIWTKFLLDFGIIYMTGLSKFDAISIFKNSTQYANTMNENQFVLALSMVAGQLYNDRFKNLNENIPKLSLEEKIQLLYKYIDSGVRKRKMSSFTKPFGQSKLRQKSTSARRFRLPANSIDSQIQAWKSKQRIIKPSKIEETKPRSLNISRTEEKIGKAPIVRQRSYRIAPKKSKDYISWNMLEQVKDSVVLDRFDLREVFNRPNDKLKNQRNKSFETERNYKHIVAMQDSRLQRGMDVARKWRVKYY